MDSGVGCSFNYKLRTWTADLYCDEHGAPTIPGPREQSMVRHQPQLGKRGSMFGSGPGPGNSDRGPKRPRSSLPSRYRPGAQLAAKDQAPASSELGASVAGASSPPRLGDPSAGSSAVGRVPSQLASMSELKVPAEVSPPVSRSHAARSSVPASPSEPNAHNGMASAPGISNLMSR